MRRVQKIRILLWVFALVLFGVHISTSGSSSKKLIKPYDIESCRGLVERFCSAWVERDYDDMYQGFGRWGIGSAQRSTFARRFEAATLRDFRVVGIIQGRNSIAVRMALDFSEEIPPGSISGVHTFHADIDEKDTWKIKYIMPPVAPPQSVNLPADSHPWK